VVASATASGQDGSSGGIYLQRYDGSAQPLGESVQVNLFTLGNQRRPSLTALPSGGFLALWEDAGQDPSGRGVFGQRFDAGGARAGDEFQVNTSTAGNQQLATAAADADGSILVVWQAGNAQDGSGAGIFGQRFDDAGGPDGEEFQVNQFTENAQQVPVVTSEVSGEFVAVWESAEQDGSNDGIFGRRLLASGATEREEFLVNTYTEGGQRRPQVAALAGGGSVVAWDGPGGGGSGRVVFAQLYDPLGLPAGTAFVINTYTPDAQRRPTVAGAPTGGFFVVWESDDQDGSGIGVFGRLFAAQGVPLTDDFQVASYRVLDQDRPVVATDNGGDSLVVWQSFAQDGQDSGVFARRYDSMASRIGSEFQVSAFTRGEQAFPAVIRLAGGGFVVAWESRLRCPGDCDGSGNVTVDELVRLVDAALLRQPANECEADANADGVVTIDELIRAVASALRSCANA
jgi:hypothetical protein